MEENSDGTKDQILTMEFGSSLILPFPQKNTISLQGKSSLVVKKKLSQGKESEMKLSQATQQLRCKGLYMCTITVHLHQASNPNY